VKLLGLELRQFGGGWQIGTQPDYAEWVFKLSRRREKTGLSPQALETLAIVAYKQPITKGEVDTIRGIDSGNQIRHLVEIELLEIRGRKDVPGRPMLYGTSKDFLKTFGLSAVDDLPAVKELKKIYSQREAQRLENEAKKAEERRQREKEEALEREKRYKPPVTELARPLSMEEREQLDAKLKEVDPIIEEQLENELDDDEVAIAEVSPEVEADDDAAAEEPVAAASSSDESDDEETTETVDDTMDVAEEEEDDDDDEYEELVWDDDEDDEEEEFDEGIFDDDDEEDEEK
jgi:segregation and condensation protein B